MATSPLDFVNSDGFRKKLITRNLTPYDKSPNRPSVQTNYVYVQSDLSVQDSPDKLIDEPSFANKLYLLNRWGNEGGYEQVQDPGVITNPKSNQGEYGPGQQDAFLLSEGIDASRTWKPLNAYGSNSLDVIDSAEAFSTLDIVYPDGGRTPNGQPYPNYNPSSYNPASILLSKDPQGSDGLLSQDSFIARLGATTLRKEFEQRIASQIRQLTIDRANIFNVRSGEDLLSIISGRVPVLEPNWTISVPQSPILAATDLSLRLAGSILPISPIPGSYWDTSINPKQPTTLGQLTNAFRRSGVGKFLNRLLGANQTGSQLFFNNTGGGQKSRLFLNIDYNKYKPSFERGLFDRVAGAIVGTANNTGGYYVGSLTSDPSRVFSPSGVLPVNEQGIEQQSPVYGPDVLSKLYEGEQQSKEIKLGANGPIYSDGGGIEGGMTWVSQKFKGDAGKKVGKGGVILDPDQNFSQTSFSSTESTNNSFREGSILDDTQRLIDSQPNDGNRYQHVGNAINQVSKIFNDGYKEITKGSKVRSYVGSIGQEVGTEYCRIFTKDTPFLTYSDLQKTDGVTTEGRRFAYSVLDKTYNLNIAPNKMNGNQSSTNLIGGSNGGNMSTAMAKKYMFSIENLAWRTSRTPGYTVNDLPVCERGPNGGRVMWFPPYDLKFTESSTPSWKPNDFIGRPEPIYTYSNTNRTGSLTWKIVVDHPSVLNVIVNKVINNLSSSEKNNILESFFAGCRKYDLYDLARQPGFVTVSPNELYDLQTKIGSKTLTREELVYVTDTLQTGVDSTGNQSQNNASNPKINPFDKFANLGFYFDNDIPKINNVVNFSVLYSNYTSSNNKTLYSTKNANTASFFTDVVEANYNQILNLIEVIKDQLKTNENGTITIEIVSSASAPASKSYNDLLSKRRSESVTEFFKNQLGDLLNTRVLLKEVNEGERGSTTNVMVYNQQTKEFQAGETYSCSDGDSPNSLSKEIYTTRAMSCRRSYIKNIVNNLQEQAPSPTTPNTVDVIQGNVVTQTTQVPTIEQNYIQRDNITKRVVRSMITECDYFEMIKEDTPLVFDNLQSKLKFFEPAFHSTTPEGLNSRLTFLQQCMRPGDTIPTIKGIDGSTTFDFTDAATNTSFGAPPVLILRVGDFYNTKIIPTGLQLNYEGLDLNPEGIGVQPMIANVTLSFNFVGGSGLKNSIDKLQNSLTFNYYANTEMWDDRADVSDDSYKVLDDEFFDFFKKQVPPPTLNQATENNGNSNGSTIGELISSNTVSGITTGELSYSKLMDSLVSISQNYFTSVINEQKTISSQYNNAVRQQWMSQRNYTNGNFKINIESVELFGKPSNFEENINTIFDTLVNNIQTNTEGFVQFVTEPRNGLLPSEIRTIKENYINYIKNKKSSFTTGITTINNNITNSVQEYISILGKINTILYGDGSNKGTDGLQVKDGNVIIYNISGTTLTGGTVPNTYEEIEDDLTKVQDNIFQFNSIINYEYSFTPTNSSTKYKGVLVTPIVNGKSIGNYRVNDDNVFIPFSNNVLFTNNVNRRVFMILSKEIVQQNLYEEFKNSLIKNSTTPARQNLINKVVDDYWVNKIKPVFLEETSLTTQFLDQIEKQKLLKQYLKFTPYDLNKKRLFTFTSESSSPSVLDTQSKLIKSLGDTSNSNTNKLTWNDSISSGAYVSKSKLN